jgi:hypothetical protein
MAKDSQMIRATLGPASERCVIGRRIVPMVCGTMGFNKLHVPGRDALRALDRHPMMSISGLIPALSCKWCCSNPPFANHIVERSDCCEQ